MRIGIGAAVVLAFFALCDPCFGQALSPRDFREEVRKALIARDATLCVKNVDEFTLKFGATARDCGSQLNIDNSYSDYRSDVSRKSVIVGRLADTAILILHPPEATEKEFKERLVAIVRPSNYVTQQAEVITLPFVGDLSVFLALDSSDRLEMVMKDRLVKFRLSEADAWALARRNTRSRMGQIERAKQSGITIVGAQSGLAPSFLWLPEACSEAATPQVVLVANRDSYFSVELQDPSGVAALSEVSKRMTAEGASMSRGLISCKAGKWVSAGPN